ncbi:MAG: hypothetical protein ACTHU5_04235, partial [Psychrobacter sp.]
TRLFSLICLFQVESGVFLVFMLINLAFISLRKQRNFCKGLHSIRNIVFADFYIQKPKKCVANYVKVDMLVLEV